MRRGLERANNRRMRMGGREGIRVIVECSGIGKLVRGREAKREDDAKGYDIVGSDVIERKRINWSERNWWIVYLHINPSFISSFAFSPTVFSCTTINFFFYCDYSFLLFLLSHLVIRWWQMLACCLNSSPELLFFCIFLLTYCRWKQ